MTYTVKQLEEQGLIIFKCISGSRAYGTNLPTSDTDIRGVFMIPIGGLLGNQYVDQVSDSTNDITYYELGRFLQLVETNNPNILEILNIPEDCVLYKDPLFDLIIENKDKFISKQCKMSFAGYAIQQIKKARGYNKKINWEESKMVRKTVLDFCYVLVNGETIPLQSHIYNYNKMKRFVGSDRRTHSDFGLANIDHARDMYAMYDLYTFDMYKGIVSDPEKTSQVQLISIPKGLPVMGHMYFNKDAYSLHCKKFKEYTEWITNRNEDRFKMNKDHGKNYDSKNLMHCIRLLDMAVEIAEQKIIVRRPTEHIKLLMKIRRGEMDFDNLMIMADKKLVLMDEVWDKSNLPNKVDKTFVNGLLIRIRKLRYGLFDHIF